MASIVTYARLVRFSHTVFAMPFALLGAFWAGSSRGGDFGKGRFWAELALVILAMAAARSAAMAFNRIADVRFDAANPRTASRELPSGSMKIAHAWWLFAACCAAFIAAAAMFGVLFANYWPLVWALPVLALLSGYSMTKRFTAWCHVILGAALGAAPVAAWLAIAPHTLGLPAVTLASGVLLWTAGFDVLYSLQDIDVDRKLGLHSIGAAMGVQASLWISRAMHVLALGMLLMSGLLLGHENRLLYFSAVALATGAVLVQHVLASRGNLARLNSTFLWCNGAVSILIGLGGIADILLAASRQGR